MSPRIVAAALVAWSCWAASDPSAAALARKAHEAEVSGQLVRAYMLYAEASARDPQNATYRTNRDSLAPAARMLTKADIENADISGGIKAAERERSNPEPPIEFAKKADWEREWTLQSVPHLQVSSAPATFELRADEKALYNRVSATFGIRAIFDPQLEPEKDIRFSITQADFRTVMEALTAVTHTFMFPLSEHEIFVARDTEPKRTEFEPSILLTFPLPDALEQKDLVEAANAVRGVLNLRAIGWDSESRTVLVRDRYTRARVARSLLEALLLPKAQVSLDVQFLTFDSEVSYHYGLSLPTSFPLLYLGQISGFKSIIPSFSGFASTLSFLSFGGGASVFGLGLTNATLFATYSKSNSRSLFDSTVVVGDGQTASLHIGDKYPIPQTLYTGFQQSNNSIYNPIGQVTLEDLGVLLKITPRIFSDGEIALDLEADLKALGTQTFNTVPSISERQFKGGVTLQAGEWAILAGLDQNSQDVTKTGIEGLSRIPGLDQIVSENSRDTQISKTLIVIKPTITRLPLSGVVNAQYLLGPQRGERVLL